MKYLSKLLSMFLVGAMLCSTGCTDYDEDIKNLNDKVDNLEQTVQGKIDVLAGDLDAVQAALQNAIDDANKAIAENKTAIADLQGVADEHGKAIDAANKAIADAVTNFEAALGELETAHDADIEAVYTKIDDEAKKATDAINAAVARITENEKAIDALEAKDAELAEDIAEAVTSIQANATKINENAAAIAENATDIAANAADIKTLQTDLLDLAGQFTTYKAELEATIATLESRLATAEEAVKTLEGNVEELYVLHDNQAALIGDLQNQINVLDSFVSEQLDLLAEADKALNDLIVNLENSFIDYQKIVNAQFEKVYGDIAENAEAINALEAKHDEEVKSLMAQDAAILGTLEMYSGWLADLDAKVEELYTMHDNQAELIGDLQKQLNALDSYVSEQIDNLNADIEALENTLMDFQKQMNEQIVRLDAAIKEALAEAKAYAEEKANNAQLAAQAYADVLVAQLEKEIEAAIAGLATQIDQVNAYAVSIEEALNAYKESNDAALAKLRGDMEALYNELLNRVQSIVFVPEYVDGKGTINWATFGTRILEGRSVLVYQVYPAECAAAIANAPAVGDVVSPLTFDMTDVLKTRGGVDKAPQMNIVGVEGDNQGRLYVTVEARNFGEDFYAGEIEYAVSLVLDNETANLSSCYTNLVAGKPEAISMRIMASKDVTLTAVNEGAKFEDVTGNNNVYTKELTYTNIDNNPDYVSLPGYYLEFEYNGEWYTKQDILAQCGLEIGDIKLERSIIAANQMGLIMNGVLAPVANETTGYTESWYDLQKVSTSLIGKEYGLAYKFFYPGTTETISAGSSILFTKEQAYVDFAPAFTATWNYLEDAAVDAAKLNISEADSFDPMAVAHYTREFGYALADAKVDNLPADTKLADVLNMEPAEVLVNGEKAENMEVVITAEGENATIEFVGFEWDKTYEIAVVYELSNVDVNVKFGFETFDRSRKPILVDLGNYTGVYATNLVFTEKVVDTMEGYIAQTVDAYPANFAGITAADYLLDVFVTNAYHECATDVTTNTVNGVPADENTKLVINKENGQTIATIYDYSDEVASKDGVIVDALAYSKKMTLWYGQEVEFVKTVNFTAPEVYFQRVANYVEEAFDGYATYVQPYYFPNSDYATALEKFDVNKVDLNAAFDLQEADATSVITVPVSGDERGIAVSANGNVYRPEFRLTDVKDIYKDGKGILLYDNYISYYGKDEFVNVDANLYLRNDNGAEMKIATNFDAAVDGYEDYTNYVVWGYNPINMPTGEDMFEEVTDYGEYEVDLTEMFSMKDRRGHTGKITGWEMINKGRVYGDNFIVDGNGENGFAEGYNAGYIYGYYLRDEKGIPYGEIIPVDVKFLLKGNDAEQLKAKDLLEVDMNTGIVKFHYTSQVDLRKPITINVAVQITTAWNVSTHENVLVIRKKADTVEVTPAE